MTDDDESMSDAPVERFDSRSGSGGGTGSEDELDEMELYRHAAADGDDDPDDDDDEDNDGEFDDDDDEDDGEGHGDAGDFLGDDGEVANALAMLRERLGVDPMLPRVADQLRSPNDSVVMDGLSRLSGLLLGGGPLLGIGRPVASALVALLQRPAGDPEVLLGAARAASQLADSGLPGAVSLLVQAGIVDALAALFRDLAYIDVAEQAVSVVQRVATDAPRAVLEAGALDGCLNCLEFFNWHIQKAVLSSVSAVCPAVSPANVATARGLAPLLLQYVSSGNPALADLALGALCSLIGALARKSPEPKRDLAECLNVWPALVERVRPQHELLAKVLRALANLAPYLPEENCGAEYAVLGPQVATALVGDATEPDQVFNALLHCPKETLAASLRLLQIVLPAPASPFKFAGPYRRPTTSPLVMGPSDLAKFVGPAARTAMRVYSASADTQMRQLALLILLKATVHAPDLVPTEELVPFLAAVVAQSDADVLVVGALDIAWELATAAPTVLPALSAELALELHVTDAPEPTTHFVSPDGDMRPVRAFLESAIAAKLAAAPSRDASELHSVVRELQSGEEAASQVLESVPRVVQQFSPPELSQSGLLSALAALSPRTLSRLGSDGVRLVAEAANDALSRAERLQVVSASAYQRSPSLSHALTRYIRVRLRSRDAPDEPGWSVSVQAIASLDVLADFVRARTGGADVILGLMGARGSSHDEIAFYQGGRRLPGDMSVLGAVYKPTDNESVLPRRLWSETFSLEYARKPQIEAVDEDHDEEVEEDDVESSTGSEFSNLPGAEVLQALAKANEWAKAPWASFVNAKLAAKLNRQLEDPLVVVAAVLPQWTFDSVRGFPFLFPVVTRRQFIEATSLGYARSLGRWQPTGDEAGNGVGGAGVAGDAGELGRLSTQKYRISRDKLLQGALKLLEMSKSSPAQIEIEFFEEAGTGLGPTQEFFALASREFSLHPGLWREQQAQGLFPRPDLGDEELPLFTGLGRLVARALLDRRILDLRLNRGFFALVLGHPNGVGRSNGSSGMLQNGSGPGESGLDALDVLEEIDPALVHSLEEILASEDASVLALDFTLPGTSLELIPGGADIDVTEENKHEYVKSVSQMTVASPRVIEAVSRFCEGFSDSVPVAALRAFLPEELATMCGGAGQTEDWSEATLTAALRADHGYTMASPPVQQLVTIMTEFTPEQRRAFLAFMTGSPNLPFGGFRALQPPFTVVLKHPDTEGGNRDEYLPSVMTCANYLKLPEYSSPDIMRERLLTAISEGSGSFPLS